MLRLALILLTAAVAAQAPIADEETAASATRPALLQALDGHWVMTGDVMGEAVTYDLVAAPTLNGAFTELHMKDVQVPAQYEARVFIGVDPDSQTVIAHWMDSFGAKFSVPHGTGRIAGNTVEFTIPYESGAFRDTLTFDPESGSWSLDIQAEQPDGSWQHFARYEMRRQVALPPGVCNTAAPHRSMSTARFVRALSMIASRASAMSKDSAGDAPLQCSGPSLTRRSKDSISAWKPFNAATGTG